jgi:hypothetical protein
MIFPAPETENTDHTYRLVVSERLMQDVLEGEATYREAFAFNSFVHKHFYCCAANIRDATLEQAEKIKEERAFLMRRRQDTTTPKGTDFFGFKNTNKTSDPLVDAMMEVYSSTNRHLSKQAVLLRSGGYIETDDVYLPARFAQDGSIYQNGKAKAYNLPEGTNLVVAEFSVENSYAAQPAPQVLTLAHTANLRATEDAHLKSEVEHEHHPELEVPTLSGRTTTEQFQLLRLYTQPTTKSEDTGRTYGPFVNLPSHLRDEVAAHNGFGVEIDLVSSQPTIAAAVTEDEQLKQDVSSGTDVYERLAGCLGSTRKEAKTAFNTTMNVRNGDKSRNTIHRAIQHHTRNPLLAAKASLYVKNRYPEFHSVVEQYRDKDGESFGGHFLSRIESEILDIDDVLPAHDAVYVRPESVEHTKTQVRIRFQNILESKIVPQLHVINHNKEETSSKAMIDNLTPDEQKQVDGFVEAADVVYDTKEEKVEALKDFIDEMQTELGRLDSINLS